VACLLQHLESVEARHLDIQKYKIGFQPVDQFAALQPVLRFANQFNFFGVICQQFFKPVAGRLLVVGYQGAVFGGSGIHNRDFFRCVFVY
jgi:hypothetical protein